MQTRQMRAVLSRRNLCKWTGLSSFAALVPMTARANSKEQAGLRYSSGLTDAPATYFEVIEPVGAGAGKPPILAIHGGAHTGSCYLMTADGRPGWAHIFAQSGHRVIIPDWPGSGRSGYTPNDGLTGETVVAGLGLVLRSLGEPAIVMTHSMSGPYGWKLLEQHGDAIAKLVAVAPGPPGNIQAVATIVSETPDKVEVHGTTSYSLDRKAPFVATSGFVASKLIGKSKQFPGEYTARYAASLQPIAPKLLFQRLNIGGAQMKVADFSKYAGKRVLLVIGTDDIDHPRDIDAPIVEWLNENGAKADFWPLGDHNISGNGHMMMIEKNSDDIAKLILSWIDAA
jgi:pimeloyl-ACP methyl ester carboxylesterase